MDFKDKETPQVQEVVLLNQEFTLFHPERTSNEPRRGDSKNTSFRLRAGLPDNEEIPVYVYTSPLTSGSLNSLFIPFSPEQGARIDRRDFSYEAREQKIKAQEASRDKSKTIRTDMGLHMLDIECQVNGLVKDSTNRKFTLPADSPLNLLRFTLSFPNGFTFEARPHALAIKMVPTIIFDNFYPVDFGQLATKTGFDFVGNAILREGLGLALPNNPDQLQQIKARFIKLQTM